MQPDQLPRVSLRAMVAVRDAISDQMRRGLSGDDDERPSLLMLPSFVDAFPSPSRPLSGRSFAIDLGGTALKIVRIEIRAGGLTDVVKREWAIPEPCYDTDNGRLLAWIVERFVACFPGVRRPLVGLCYSFACRCVFRPVWGRGSLYPRYTIARRRPHHNRRGETSFFHLPRVLTHVSPTRRQENLDHGEQIMWTKRFRGTGLLGKDVVQVRTVVAARLATEVLFYSHPLTPTHTHSQSRRFGTSLPRRASRRRSRR